LKFEWTRCSCVLKGRLHVQYYSDRQHITILYYIISMHNNVYIGLQGLDHLCTCVIITYGNTWFRYTFTTKNVLRSDSLVYRRNIDLDKFHNRTNYMFPLNVLLEYLNQSGILVFLFSWSLNCKLKWLSLNLTST